MHRIRTYRQSAAAFWRSRDGATAIDYALIIGLVAMASLVGFNVLGDSVSNMFLFVSTNVTNVMPSGG